HTINMSPDARYFVDVAQAHDVAPKTTLADADGKPVAEVAASDLSKFEELGLKKLEMFTYTAADGKTPLYGLIHFPSTFDPAKTYPALVTVYGGPVSASNVAAERFSVPNPNTESGFLVINRDARAVPGLGKRTLDSLYLKLGQVEMDDMAAGVKALWNRSDFYRIRDVVAGTCYGGVCAV